MQMKKNQTYKHPNSRYIMAFDIETFLNTKRKPQRHEFILGTICLYDIPKDRYYRYEFFDRHQMSRFITTTKFSGTNSFNVGFNVAYDLYQLPLVYHKNFNDYQKGRVYIAKYYKRHRQIRFVDLANFYSGSLNDVGKLFHQQKMDKPPYLGERPPQTPEEHDYLLEYCYHDSYITNIIAQYLYQQFQTFTTGICVTPSQLSFRTFRTRFQHHDIFGNKIPFQLKKFRSAYHGGRTEALQLGTIHGNIKSYDFNSAYVYAMQEHPLPITPFEKVVNPTHTDVKEGIANQLSCFAEIIISQQPTQYLGYIPYFHENLKFPIGKFSAKLFTPELHLLLRHHIPFRIKRLYVAKAEPFARPFARWVWKNRREATSTIENLYFKGLGNFFYGKFAQINEFYHRAKQFDYLKIPNINEVDIHIDNECIHVKFYYNKAYVKQLKPSKTMSIPIASEITSFVRAYLLEHMLQKQNHLVYVDTDSLFLKNATLPQSNQLGGLKIEGQGDHIEIFKEKIYSLYQKENLVKRATKGFPQTVTVNNQKQQIVLHFSQDHTKFHVEFSKLATPKTAYIRHKNPYVPIPITKKFDLTLHTKRKLLQNDFTRQINTRPFDTKTFKSS